MQNIFDDMFYHTVEFYIDDLVVKTKSRRYHLEDLRIIFERLRKFDLKMNPLKCAFGVTSGKFLGFIVCHRGIEVDPAMIYAIQKMPEPKNLREIRSLQGNLAFIWRFISNLARRSYTIKLISRVDPVKFVITRPVLFGRLARWFILFNQNEITYTPPKAVKGQALADFLVDYPLPTEWELSNEFPDEDILFIGELTPWTMFFDGSARRNGVRACVVLISPDRQVLPFSFVLAKTCSYNATEYQALIIGHEMELDIKILQLEIDFESKLIINQLLGIYNVKNEDIFPNHQYASCLLERFDQVFLNHVPREENCMDDALANLVTTMALGENESIKVHVCHRWVIPRLLNLQINESHHTSVGVIEEEDWRQPLIDFLEHGKLPEDLRQRTNIKRRAPRFIFYKGTLFRCSFEGLFLQCLDKEEAH
ncbi:uncharacterized protein LOC142162205 [Nicotiana tabacum]|uniref:Uncharacterized protein LOC142162205 n=1 Tax=Nicotiana tabacum TaxID=4097 RepID=A0AC58RPI2_TOBAC